MANYNDNRYNSMTSSFRDNDNNKSNNDRFKNLEDKISETTEASELVAETVENKGNQINSSIGETNKINLNIDKSTTSSADDLKSIHAVSSTISNKISTFTTILKEKLDIKKGVAQPSSKLQESTEKTLSELLPLPVEDVPLQEIVKGIVSTPEPKETPEEKFYPPDQNDDKKGKGKSKTTRGGKDKDDEIIKTLKGGFNKSLSVSNRIAAFLFTISVTAVASLAAIGATLFSIILAVDVLRIHIKYWMGLLNSNFEEFDKKLGKLAPFFETVAEYLKDIYHFFKNGEYVKGIMRVGEYIFDMGKLLIEGILYGISKLVASVLRLFGMDEKADDVEAQALMRYSLNTGYTPTDEELEKIGVYKAKQISDPETLKMNQALDLYNQTEGRIGEEPDYSDNQKRDNDLSQQFNDLKMTQKEKENALSTEHLLKVEYGKISERAEKYRDEPSRIDELETQLEALKAKSDNIKMPQSMRNELEQEYNIISNQLYNAKNNRDEPTIEQAPDLRSQEQVQNINNANTENNTSNINNEHNTNVVNQNNVRNTNIISNDVRTNIPRAGMQSIATMAGVLLK